MRWLEGKGSWNHSASEVLKERKIAARLVSKKVVDCDGSRCLILGRLRIVSELLLACTADLDCSDLAHLWMIRVNLWYSGSFGNLYRMYWM